jgi:hypothetical protein
MILVVRLGQLTDNGAVHAHHMCFGCVEKFDNSLSHWFGFV